VVLFDFSRFDLKLELTKPNDNDVYRPGDFVRGKVVLQIKRQFYSEKMYLRLIKESKITVKSKLDNKETTDKRTEFVFNEMIDNSNNYDLKQYAENTKYWPFQILIPKGNTQADQTLMERFFDAFYPAKIEHKYYLEVIFSFSLRKDEIIKKELKVQE
jgi:hypothetical protein